MTSGRADSFFAVSIYFAVFYLCTNGSVHCCLNVKIFDYYSDTTKVSSTLLKSKVIIVFLDLTTIISMFLACFRIVNHV